MMQDLTHLSNAVMSLEQDCNVVRVVAIWSKLYTVHKKVRCCVTPQIMRERYNLAIV